MSDRTKDRAALLLTETNSTRKLQHATYKSARKGRESLARLMKKTFETGTASELMNLASIGKKQQVKMIPPEIALALIATISLSQDDYSLYFTS